MASSSSDSGRKAFVLYPARTTLGWRVIKRVSLQKGEMMVAVGEWRRVLDCVTREHIGYQVCAPEMARGDYELPSMSSSASITAREMEINAGLMGKSQTEGMSESKRAERRVMEDSVERVRCKVICWPHVGARKQDILRVWPA